MPLYVVGTRRVMIEDLLLPPQVRVRFWARDTPQGEPGGESEMDEAYKTYNAQGEQEMECRYHLGAESGGCRCMLL